MAEMPVETVTVARAGEKKVWPTLKGAAAEEAALLSCGMKLRKMRWLSGVGTSAERRQRHSVAVTARPSSLESTPLEDESVRPPAHLRACARSARRAQSWKSGAVEGVEGAVEGAMGGTVEGGVEGAVEGAAGARRVDGRGARGAREGERRDSKRLGPLPPEAVSAEGVDRDLIGGGVHETSLREEGDMLGRSE